jgi:competence protein ComEA
MTISFTQWALTCIAWALAGSTARAQLPDGPGMDVTAKICGKCHEAELLKGYRQGTDGWTETISKMINAGAVGTDEQFEMVLDYLVKNFGPDAPAPIKINKATASELEPALEITAKESAAIVKYRTENGPFKSIDDLKKVPDLDFKKIETKRNRLVF